MPDYEPKMCCSGRDCGCLGQPTEPQICSTKCYDKMKDNQKMNAIRGELNKITFGEPKHWMKIKRFDETRYDDWKDVYNALSKHHKEETEYLLDKIKEHATILRNVIDNAMNEGNLAINQQRIAEDKSLYDGIMKAHNSTLDTVIK